MFILVNCGTIQILFNLIPLLFFFFCFFLKKSFLFPSICQISQPPAGVQFFEGKSCFSLCCSDRYMWKCPTDARFTKCTPTTKLLFFFFPRTFQSTSLILFILSFSSFFFGMSSCTVVGATVLHSRASWKKKINKKKINKKEEKIGKRIRNSLKRPNTPGLF